MQNGIRQADAGRRFDEVLREGGWSHIRLVYWTGAAIFFKADVELRESTDNRQSLDSVLGEFQRCCLPSGRLWSARQLFAEFDRIAGRPVFQPLADTYLRRTGFPDIDVELKQLGVIRKPGGGVALDATAPLANVAAGIMGSSSNADSPR